MEFLYPEFENEIEPFVEGDVVMIGPFAFTGPEILRRAGQDSYKKAFDQWVWDVWIPSRRERKDDLLKIHSNGARYEDVRKLIESGGAIPFVGSGMSVPTGMPMWSTFLQETCHRTLGFTVAELKTCLDAGDYEDAASRIFGSMPVQLFNERFENNFKIKSNQVIGGAVRLLPRLFESNLITTNFDTVLEQVYTTAERTFQEILCGQAVAEFRRKCNHGTRCLVKLHGKYDSTHGRVLLKHEYEGFYNQGCTGREELSLIFRRGGLVFLGCSLFQDRTMALLKEIAESDLNMPRHYALLKIPDPNELVAREHFLTERNIFPIWYDGDHNTDVEAILVGLMEDLRKL